MPGKKPVVNLQKSYLGISSEKGIDQFMFFAVLRRLVRKLYEAEHEEEFAQRLLGHKNLTMTKKYLDARGAEYVMVQTGYGKFE